MACDRQGESLVHQFDAEVECLTRRHEAIKAVARPGAGDEPRVDRRKPSPVALPGDEARGIAEALDRQRHRGRTHVRAEVSDEIATSLGRDALGRRPEKVLGMISAQEPQPTAIAYSHAFSAAFSQVSPLPAGFVEQVAGPEGRLERPTIRGGPLNFGKMPQEAHGSSRVGTT